MKTLLLSMLALAFCSVVALADDFPVVRLAEDIGVKGSNGYDQQIVKLVFGWREGENMLAASNGKPKNKGILGAKKKVLIPDDAGAKAWFASLPTREGSPSTQTVYVKISSGSGSEVLGSRLKDGQPAW